MYKLVYLLFFFSYRVWYNTVFDEWSGVFYEIEKDVDVKFTP